MVCGDPFTVTGRPSIYKYLQLLRFFTPSRPLISSLSGDGAAAAVTSWLSQMKARQYGDSLLHGGWGGWSSNGHGPKRAINSLGNPPD